MIRKLILFLALGFVTVQKPLLAQEFIPTPVEISTEKVRVNGAVYYAHVVLKGQTLFSIGKAYQVHLDELRQVNPKLAEGLKAGDLLLIPVEPQMPVEATTEAPAEVPAAVPVPVTEVPVAEVPVTETPVMEVPETESAKAPVAASTTQTFTEEEMEKHFSKHKVKWYETLEDVAEKYEVPTGALMALNKLETDKVKRRQILYIPDAEYVAAWQWAALRSTAAPQEEAVDERRLYPDVPVPDIGLYPDRRRTGKISLILPLYAQNPDVRTNRTNATDFYCGFLMGMKHLEDRQGINEYNLQVIDQGAYLSLEEMVYSGVLDGSELIVGPVTASDMSIVAAYAQLEQVPIVSPLDAKADELLKDNPYLFQFPANTADLTDNILKRLSVRDSARVTLVYERGSRHSQLVQHKFDELKRLNIPFDSLTYGILEGRGMDTLMAKKVHTRALNQYVVASENEAFVSDVLRNLHLLHGNTQAPVRVFGEIKWKNYTTIEPNYYHELNLQLPQLYYVNYNDPATAAYVKEYYETFGTEPTPFAFQGYDIACYFLRLLRTYGWSFPVHVTQMETELLQSGVHFVPIEENSGFKNTKGRTISYEANWQIKQ